MLKLKKSFTILTLAIYVGIILLMFFRSGDYTQSAGISQAYRYLILLAQFAACGVIVLLARSPGLKKFIIRHHIKILVGIFVTAIIIRVAYVFTVGTHLEYKEDLGRYLGYTQVMTNSGGAEFSESTLKYITIFPHIIGTPMIMSIFLSLVGFSTVNYLLINVVFGILSGVLIYFIIKQIFNKNYALISALIWGINPFTLNYEMLITETPVVTFFILLCIFLWLEVLRQKNMGLVILYTILCGISCVLAQFTRPIAVIFIIAALITLFFYKKNIKFKIDKKLYPLINNLIISGILISTFTTGVLILEWKVENLTGNELPGQRIGYNFYVGSNPQRGGQWIPEAEKLFREKMEELPASEIHTFFFEEGLKNYKDNGFAVNFSLLHEKLKVITNETIEKPVLYLYKGIEQLEGVSAETVDRFMPVIWIDCIIFVSLNYACAALGAVGLALKYKKYKKIPEGLFLIALFFVGAIVGSLLFEVSFRYTYYANLLAIVLVPCVFEFIIKKRRVSDAYHNNRESGER